MGTSHKKLNSATEALKLSKERAEHLVKKYKVELTQKLIDAVELSVSQGSTSTSGLLKSRREIYYLIQPNKLTEVGEYIKDYFEKNGYRIEITIDGVNIYWE